jgi:hypothetical protein
MNEDETEKEELRFGKKEGKNEEKRGGWLTDEPKAS